MAITGKWQLNFDWDCDGTYTTTFLTFNADGTWTGGEFVSGRWMELNGQLIFNHDNAPAVYFGNVVGSVASGTMTDFGKGNGCWYMIRHAPVAPAKEKADRDLAGNPTKSS